MTENTSEAAVNLHDTMSAEVWAKEFCRIVGEKVPDIRKHEDWMLTWFANAIMTGHDHARRQFEPPPEEAS